MWFVLNNVKMYREQLPLNSPRPPEPTANDINDINDTNMSFQLTLQKWMSSINANQWIMAVTSAAAEMTTFDVEQLDQHLPSFLQLALYAHRHFVRRHFFFAF